jgi:acetyl-CoA synthetase
MAGSSSHGVTQTMTSRAAAFIEARDFLLAHREHQNDAVRAFRWPRLEYFNWALDYFDAFADGNASTALWITDGDCIDERCSYAELSERSNRVANALRALGAQRGERILLMVPNVAPMWQTMLAAMKLGLVVVPTTTQIGASDLADRMKRGAIRHVVADSDGAARFGEIRGEYTRLITGGARAGWIPFERSYEAASAFTPDAATRASDLLLLYFTSGTTSRPKLVAHTHASYPVGHLSTLYWIGLRAGDIHCNISSPGWAKHAWSSVFAPWNAGATSLAYHYTRFDPRRTLDMLVRCGVTTLCAPPTVWRMLVGEDLPRWRVALREVVSAGEPLNPEVIERVQRAWGLTIRDGYGQTETTAQIGNAPGQAVKPGSMGRALPGYTVKLLDANGVESDEGEIALALEPRPLGLMQAYLDDEVRTAEVMREGYYHTGDVAQRDPDGYITYVGRADDVFKSSDYRISPFELESALVEHAAVAEAAVVPSPDPVRLSVPKAFVVLRTDALPSRDTALAIFRFLRTRLAPYQRIRCIEFSELPKTISGKIRRVELRIREAGRDRAQRTEHEYWEQDFPELRER